MSRTVAGILVEWTAPTEGGSEYVIVECISFNGDCPSSAVNVTGTQTHAFESLTPGATYSFNLTVVNAGLSSTTQTTSEIVIGEQLFIIVSF